MRPGGPGRWTKKDLSTLRSQIDSFVLQNRMYYPMARIRAAVSESRSEITIGGLRGFRAMLLERRDGPTGYAATAKHYASGACGPGCEEVAERFARLTIEGTQAIAKIDHLIARLERDGLPAEVGDYLPDYARGADYRP